jgi:hypothetical protein
MRGRSIVSYNFLAAIVIGVLWFGWQAYSGLSETDPTKLRVNRVPLGAFVIIVIEGLLLVLYLRAGELVGLVRVFAGLMGIVQMLQLLAGGIGGLVEGIPFPTANHWVMGYLALSNLAYALIGERKANAGR